MSKNHPNDNIYSILGKLDALSPKEQPAQEAPKKIYESVEARGSIMSGVTRLEKKLSEQYAADKKALDTNPKNAAWDDDALAKQRARIAREKNLMSMQRKVSGMDTGQPPAVKEGIAEGSAHGYNVAKWYEKNGDQLKLTRWLRKEAGLPKDAPVYFDDADLVYGDKTIVSSALVNPKLKFNDLLTALTQATGGQGKQNVDGVYREQGVTEDAAPVKYGVFSKGGSIGSQKFKDEPLKTFDSKEEAIADAKRRRSGLSKGERGYYRMGYVVKAIKGLAEDDVDDFLARGGKITQVKPNKGPRNPGLSLGSKHIGGGGDKMKASRTGRKSNPQGKATVAVEGWDDMVKAGKARDAETRSGKKATATGIKHQGKYGTDYQGDSDSEDDNQHKADKGIRKRGRPAKGTPKKAAASTEKKGVGRPKKAAAPTYSGAAGLQSFFGSTAPKKSKVKGTVHKMDESRMMDESKNTFQHILNRFKHEVKKFEEGEPIEYGSDLFHALYDYYVEAGEMPYGIQKARTGMPDEWISDRLEQDLGLSGTSLSNMSAPRPGPEMDNELNELARLAGLGEATIKKADKDYDQDGEIESGKDEVIGSRRKAAGLDDEQLDEGLCESCNCKPCECNEGNAFGKAIRAAKADGVQPGEKVRVGDKDYAVKEAQELSAMLRVAGINTDQIDEAIKYVTEGSMKRWLEGLAMQLDKSDFVANADEYGMTPEEAAQWWINCNGGDDDDHDYHNSLDAEQYGDENFDESIPVHKHVDGPFDPNWTPGDDEGETCPECDGAGCPECYGDEHRDRAHDYAQGMERESLGMDEEANSPDEDYYSIKGSTMGPGEGDPGEKNMYGGPGDNRMTQPPARPAKPVMQVRESGLTLEARLAAEYESIKKVSNEGIMGRVGGAIKNAIGKKATRPVSGPGSAPNVFDVEPYKSDTKAYLKKSAKQPNGPSNVKNIFDK